MVGRRAAAVPAIVPGRAPMPHISLDFLRADISDSDSGTPGSGASGGPVRSARDGLREQRRESPYSLRQKSRLPEIAAADDDLVPGINALFEGVRIIKGTARPPPRILGLRKRPGAVTPQQLSAYARHPTTGAAVKPKPPPPAVMLRHGLRVPPGGGTPRAPATAKLPAPPPAPPPPPPPQISPRAKELELKRDELRAQLNSERSMWVDDAATAAERRPGSARVPTKRAAPAESPRPGTARPGFGRALAPRASNTSGGATDPLAAFGYRTKGPIGAGAFSMVKLAMATASRREVAVKSWNKAKLAKHEGKEKAMQTELDALRRLQPSAHAGVANLVAYHDGKLQAHMVLEYCVGGSLRRHLQQLSKARGAAATRWAAPDGYSDQPTRSKGMAEAAAADLLRQLASALLHLHALGVAHRDVKPENLLFADTAKRTIKLCDFGFAVHCADRRLKTMCGSPLYMAPEIMRGGGSSYAGAPVDMWSMGAVAYEMLHNRPAFHAESMDELKMRVRKLMVQPTSAALSADAHGFLKTLLVLDPAARATGAALLRLKWLGGDGGPAPSPRRPILE